MAGNAYQSFLDTLWGYYDDHGRHDLPWRQPEPDGNFDPYKIMVSEIMLQQTQVPRVIPKYRDFLSYFPDVNSLAGAPLSDVLSLWSGLGYNRRAQFLWQTAKQVKELYDDRIPDQLEQLVTLPGIGKNTSGAILAYGFNSPAVFVETNVRTVYIHHFFADKQNVHDAEILPLIEASLKLVNEKAPRTREFYWALMDYGSYLKKEVGNLNKLSKHYSVQSRFQGSNRQIRGQVIRLLVDGPMTDRGLATQIKDDRLPGVLETLLREGMLMKTGSKYQLVQR